jgi:carbamoyltransferase
MTSSTEHVNGGSGLRAISPPSTFRGRLKGWLGHKPARMEAVLGIACTGHGASVALVTADGTIRSSVLDRWSGVKHILMLARREERSIRNPTSLIDRQIKWVLCAGRGGFPPTLIFEDTILEWLNWFLRDLSITPADIDLVVTSESHFATCYLRLGTKLHRWFPNAWVSNRIEHHEVHQRQAFWQSGFEEAAVLTLDSCGEKLSRLGDRALSGTIAVMDASGRHRTPQNIFFPESSPGLLYDVVNRHCGFNTGDEGKTMGLAPYGTPALFRSLEPLLHLCPDGHFEFISHQELEQKLAEYEPARWPGAELTQGHRDVAYAGQALLEKIVVNAFAAALRLTGQRKLAYAGGIALNSVANEIAYQAVRPDGLYIAPNPGDTGHALGCALFGAHEIAGWPPSLKEIPDFIGPAYSDAEMIEAARASGYQVIEPVDIAREMARCIADGCITARFAGRAEHGPRALGNRSILCDPRPATMKGYLNERVKHRESFRPFAPAVLEEDAAEWFDIAERSPYMLRVVQVRPERRDQVAATVHVDGSCRVQTVGAAENPGFHELLRAFKALSGVPVVLNTSFNIAGKPIVETPRDAVECFAGTDIDVLALGPVLLSKRPPAAS